MLILIVCGFCKYKYYGERLKDFYFVVICNGVDLFFKCILILVLWLIKICVVLVWFNLVEKWSKDVFFLLRLLSNLILLLFKRNFFSFVIVLFWRMFCVNCECVERGVKYLLIGESLKLLLIILIFKRFVVVVCWLRNGELFDFSLFVISEDIVFVGRFFLYDLMI